MCIRDLVNLAENPLLQIPKSSESRFDSLPFEIQLRFMCYSKSSELYNTMNDIQNATSSLDYTMKVFIFWVIN